MTLKVYGDLQSQPVRAVVLFCLVNNIRHELVNVSLIKNENKLPGFKAINPAAKMPVIDDDGFILTESLAILRYLAASRHAPDHWYPAEVKSRARVDSLLDSYHTNIRQTAPYIKQKELLPCLWGLPRGPDALIKFHETNMTTAMDLVEEYYLKPEEGPFLLGASQPSLADILFAFEYTQTQFLPREEQEKFLGSRSKTKKWLEVVEKSFAPHFGEVHKKFPDLIKKIEMARRDHVAEGA
ncbi:hypothetical protein R1flu_018063 [Riccia fluitans]|uniref:GST N-terminal domain-containing protein n=1 Tax=Riccia fluitans TaxID=41844 RepID=A0ABD1ZER5_9MARC